ncbi:MAG: ABC transporter ATP-binding protein [Candidatus Doudnabacteria bacterium]|nr:ABC transporter ATP-binding protein [Candidatus Doudnabacteria bacterium]
MTNPLVYLFRKMWGYARGNHRNVILYILMSVSANLLLALEPLIVGLFLNTLQINGVHRETLPYLFFILSLLPLLEICFWSLHGPSRVIENRNAFQIRRNYKNYLLEGTMALPMEWHTDHHSGDTIDKIEKGTTALFSFSERTFEIIQGVITLITAFAAMFFFDALAGGVALAISIFTFFALTLFDKRLVPGYKIVNRMENTISAKIFDALSNVTTVIILRVESLVLKSIDGFIKKPFPRFHINNKINEWKWFTASIFGRIAVITVVGIYLLSHIAVGAVLVGTIYILYGYTNQIRDTFFKFAYLYNDIVRYRASVSNTEELSKDFRQVSLSEDKRLPQDWSKLTIANLSFSYHVEDGADLHLDGVSLTVKKGERVALIGESGGGKTTFLRIMRDLYHPKTLKLSMAGKAIPDGFAAISDSISLIPQDPEIFATTIRENLTLGVEYTDEHLKIFTDMSRLTQIIERLPKKLESSIVEKGVNLSGGEKQRLALARGLLASVDKDIVLMDEPTSSVDFQNELDIFRNIFTAFPKQAIIASVHRLHLLSLFDTVYFFEDGKIIASGTFEQLKKSSPEFQALWEKYIQTRDS